MDFLKKNFSVVLCSFIDLDAFGATLTSCQQCVMSFGGVCRSEHVNLFHRIDCIYVLDLNVGKLMKNTVHCRNTVFHSAIIMRNKIEEDLIITGFTPECWMDFYKIYFSFSNNK